MLLPHVPRNHRYKVIFMTRDMDEILASQTSMITRLGTEGATMETEQLKHALRVHRDEALRWLRASRHVEFIEVDYTELVRRPEPIVARLTEFLGADVLSNAAGMAASIDPKLYRKRRQPSTTIPPATQ